MTRVAFLIDSLGSGGAERSTAVLLPHLRERGIEASVITIERAAEGNEDVVRGDGFPVHVLAPGSFVARCRELRKVLNEQRPDVLNTALFRSDQLARIATIGMRLPIVTTLVNVPREAKPAWGTGPAPWKVRLVNALDIVTSHLFVDRFHAVTPGVASLYQRRYRLPARKITVVERGRDISALGTASPERRARVRESLGLGEHEMVLLAAGRVDQQKNHPDLVRAVKRVLDGGQPAVLLIAGRDGDAVAEVKALLHSDPDLARAVRLLGYRSDIGDLLAAADLMVLSSRFEGTAGIALEAMAVGTAIVSTDLPGMEGILVNGENSLLVPVGHVAALATAISTVLSDDGLRSRFVDRGRLEFLDRFTIDRSADRMADLYRGMAPA